jgi:hypothetical protein
MAPFDQPQRREGLYEDCQVIAFVVLDSLRTLTFDDHLTTSGTILEVPTTT